MKNILTCTDCQQPYCADCEEGGKCPECKAAMCDDCYWEAAQSRQNRCATCDDPGLATVRFPYPDGRKLYANHREPQRGKLPCL